MGSSQAQRPPYPRSPGASWGFGLCQRAASEVSVSVPLALVAASLISRAARHTPSPAAWRLEPVPSGRFGSPFVGSGGLRPSFPGRGADSGSPTGTSRRKRREAVPGTEGMKRPRARASITYRVRKVKPSLQSIATSRFVEFCEVNVRRQLPRRRVDLTKREDRLLHRPRSVIRHMLREFSLG